MSLPGLVGSTRLVVIGVGDTCPTATTDDTGAATLAVGAPAAGVVWKVTAIIIGVLDPPDVGALSPVVWISDGEFGDPRGYLLGTQDGLFNFADPSNGLYVGSGNTLSAFFSGANPGVAVWCRAQYEIMAHR